MWRHAPTRGPAPDSESLTSPRGSLAASSWRAARPAGLRVCASGTLPAAVSSSCRERRSQACVPCSRPWLSHSGSSAPGAPAVPAPAPAPYPEFGTWGAGWSHAVRSLSPCCAKPWPRVRRRRQQVLRAACPPMPMAPGSMSLPAGPPLRFRVQNCLRGVLIQGPRAERRGRPGRCKGRNARGLPPQVPEALLLALGGASHPILTLQRPGGPFWQAQLGNHASHRPGVRPPGPVPLRRWRACPDCRCGGHGATERPNHGCGCRRGAPIDAARPKAAGAFPEGRPSPRPPLAPPPPRVPQE